MYRKLNLDRDKVDACRLSAQRSFAPVFRFIEQHSSVSIESASLTLLGVPDAEKVVSTFSRHELRDGVFPHLLRVMQGGKLSLKEACEQVANRKVKWSELPTLNLAEAKNLLHTALEELRYQCESAKAVHQALSRRYHANKRPLKALSVSLNVGKDFSTQLRELLETHAASIDQLNCHFTDLSPEQAKNTFTELRKILDDYNGRLNRFIRLGVSLSLPSAQFAALAFEQRIELLENDFLFQSLFASVHPRFAVVEHAFICLLAANSGMLLQSQDAEVSKRIDTYRYGHQILSDMVIHDVLSRQYGLSSEQMCLSQAFQLAPDIEDGWLFELAQVQMVREHFMKSPLVLRCDELHPQLPTYLQRSGLVLAEVLGLISEQSVFEFNAANTSATLVVQQLKQLDAFAKSLRTAGDELVVSSNGKIARRAHTLLENSERQLQKIEQLGFFEALEQGVLQGEKTAESSTLIGADNYFQKEKHYYNPVLELFKGGCEEGLC